MLSEFLALDGKMTIIAFAAIVKVSVKMVWESQRKKAGKELRKCKENVPFCCKKNFFLVT